MTSDLFAGGNMNRDLMAGIVRAWQETIESAERVGPVIQGLADAGASDELLAAFAIRAEMCKYPPPDDHQPGLRYIGATEYDLGRAAVDALRRVGRLREVDAA